MRFCTIFACLISLLQLSCNNAVKTVSSPSADTTALKPVVVSEKVYDDSDDPAIWIHPLDKRKSLVIGTDKHKSNGGLFVFDLQGKIDSARSVTGLQRVNNVDVAYGLMLNGKPVDIAVCTERDRNCIRVFSLPDMKPVDGGGIEVFFNEEQRLPMGIALYTRPSDNTVYAIVGRKWGPTEGYLEQYRLTDNGSGTVVGELVRKFGKFSGKKEIEAIAVDNELGYVYYSDEQAGIRKYYADPAKGAEELAFFGQSDFANDNEGISIYKLDNKTGYIVVSDQGANKFVVYPREGTKENPHRHQPIVSLPFSTDESDGSEVTSVSLPGFEGGLFVAMSTDKTFQYYRWVDIARRGGLKVKRK